MRELSIFVIVTMTYRTADTYYLFYQMKRLLILTSFKSDKQFITFEQIGSTADVWNVGICFKIFKNLKQ